MAKKKKTTKRVGKMVPKTKELMQLVRRQEALTEDLLDIALRLDATAKATDAASILLTLEHTE